MPKYTLVVPTLNRAHLLEGTLESLAKLDHDSYEVIISNNSSSDQTEAVAKRWTETNPRFRYVRTNETLAMSDHWEFALGFVEGDYFLYVGDDDSFDRNILKVLDQYIAGDGAEGVYWRQAIYYHQSWFQEQRAGNLYILPYTGRKWVIQAKDAIQQMFDLNIPKTFPLATSFCFKTSLVRSIVEECGVFFVRPYPDYTATMMYLPSITSYLYVDMALSVIGKSADSNAASLMEGPKDRIQQFLREHKGEVYPHMPMNYHVIFNGTAECVTAVQLLRSKELGSYQMDWVQYFRGMYNYIQLDVELAEDEKGMRQYWKALFQRPLKEQLQIINYVLRIKLFKLRQKMKSGGTQNPATAAADIHSGHFCKRMLSVTECSQELSEHNLKLGYF
jgi:glycosyltransferase involved in cell wall biosynthesis